MLAFGIGYRELAAKLSTNISTLSISPEMLKELPMQIGQWTGAEVPIDEKIVQATDTDAHISRNYFRYNDSESVWLYVAFGVKARDLMPHRPEVCYVGAGWTLMDRHSLDLPKDDGQTIPSTIFMFSRGTLNTEKIITMDYYIVDGQYCRDVSLLRSKAWRGSGTIGYVAQVQIVALASTNPYENSTEEIIRDFAVESAPFLSALLEKIQVKNPNKDFKNTPGKEDID